MSEAGSKLTRIAVFYDGNFFAHVSNYYNYNHERRARLNVAGLHEFIRHQVADNEGSDIKYCHIVDAHYFRGRPRARAAEQRGILLRERLFDDVLVQEGVVTHYLPLRGEGEMGIDVWLALEAYELAIYKRFDVSVLVAGDGDFLPLVRKLNTLGTRVMLLAWDFKFTDQDQRERETRTAQVLLDEVTYPVMMHQVIDDRSKRNDASINNLFLSPRAPTAVGAQPTTGAKPVAAQSDDRAHGKIKSLKEGFGFIIPASGGSDLFFFHTEVANLDFNELVPGDSVTYRLSKNDRGPVAVDIEVIRNTGTS